MVDIFVTRNYFASFTVKIIELWRRHDKSVLNKPIRNVPVLYRPIHTKEQHNNKENPISPKVFLGSGNKDRPEKIELHARKCFLFSLSVVYRSYGGEHCVFIVVCTQQGNI